MYYKENAYRQRSLLRSTRHKNWLKSPSELEIGIEKLSLSPLFHIDKKSGGTRIVAMVKDTSDSKKRSGVTPFLYKPELWPEDAATQNIETTENGNKLKSKMRVLEGDEVPEQLMIWLEDYDDKIRNNVSLSAEAKLGFLKRLVASEAQSILSQVERDYKDNYSKPEHISLLEDYKIQKEICQKYTTDAQV